MLIYLNVRIFKEKNTLNLCRKQLCEGMQGNPIINASKQSFIHAAMRIYLYFFQALY